MATTASKPATQPAPAQQSQPAPTKQPTPQADPAQLLNEILDRQPAVKRYGLIDGALRDRVAKVEAALPPQLRGQGERFVQRAMVTFMRRPELHTVTPESFIRCVLEAAELGLAIDGRLAHAVKFSNKYKVDGKDVWRDESQLMVDYKGVIATARRTNVIKDCYARLVREGDRFACGDKNGQAWLEFEPLLSGGGDVVGAFAIVKLPDGDWRHEWMTLAEINQVRGKSKAFQKKHGPWCGTDTEQDEMRKKTVIRRALKTYADDPAIARLLELEARDDEHDDERPQTTLPLGRSSLRGPVATNGDATHDQTQTAPTVEQYQTQEPQPGQPSGEQQASISQLLADKEIAVRHWQQDYKARTGKDVKDMTAADADAEIEYLGKLGNESTGGE